MIKEGFDQWWEENKESETFDFLKGQLKLISKPVQSGDRIMEFSLSDAILFLHTRLLHHVDNDTSFQFMSAVMYSSCQVRCANQRLILCGQYELTPKYPEYDYYD